MWRPREKRQQGTQKKLGSESRNENSDHPDMFFSSVGDLTKILAALHKTRGAGVEGVMCIEKSVRLRVGWSLNEPINGEEIGTGR